jgi:hypothetical protein
MFMAVFFPFCPPMAACELARLIRRLHLWRRNPVSVRKEIRRRNYSALRRPGVFKFLAGESVSLLSGYSA